jgi:hypothetical protein
MSDAHPIDRRAFLVTAAAGLVGARSAAAASEAPVVVELFTSQGCSSCPPADAFLAELARRPGVIAVSYNVDYWDYLGWRDTLASPVYSRRQRDYAARRGDGQVYTPQMVVNGRRHEVGSRKEAVYEAIAAEGRERAGIVPMRAGEIADEIVVEVAGAPTDRLRQDSTVWVLMVMPRVTVAIARGENSGREITYVNSVRRILPVGMWHGEAVTLKLPKADLMVEGASICMAFLQVGGVGPILSATRYPAA